MKLLYFLWILKNETRICRSSHPEVFLGKNILKTCSKFTGEDPCQIVISIKLLCTIRIAVLYICWIFSEHFYLRTPLKDCFCIWVKNSSVKSSGPSKEHGGINSSTWKLEIRKASAFKCERTLSVCAIVTESCGLLKFYFIIAS